MTPPRPVASWLGRAHHGTPTHHLDGAFDVCSRLLAISRDSGIPLGAWPHPTASAGSHCTGPRRFGTLWDPNAGPTALHQVLRSQILGGPR